MDQICNPMEFRPTCVINQLGKQDIYRLQGPIHYTLVPDHVQCTMKIIHVPEVDLEVHVQVTNLD